MLAVRKLAEIVGVQSACDALSVPRSSFYRWQKPSETKPRPTPPPALDVEEREEVRAVLDSEEFVDCAPAQVYASLLDRDVYLCSVRTMYRILDEHDEVKERRALCANDCGTPAPPGISVEGEEVVTRWHRRRSDLPWIRCDRAQPLASVSSHATTPNHSAIP